MNVYDFDGTIYDGDATVGFIFYTVRRHPLAMIKSLPKQVMAVAAHLIQQLVLQVHIFNQWEMHMAEVAARVQLTQVQQMVATVL